MGSLDRDVSWPPFALENAHFRVSTRQHALLQHP